MTSKKIRKDQHASSPEVLNPTGDHSGRLEAAMGVYQCVVSFAFLWQRRHWQRIGRQEGGECLDRVHNNNNSGCSVETKGASSFFKQYILKWDILFKFPLLMEVFWHGQGWNQSFQPARDEEEEGVCNQVERRGVWPE